MLEIKTRDVEGLKQARARAFYQRILEAYQARDANGYREAIAGLTGATLIQPATALKVRRAAFLQHQKVQSDLRSSLCRVGTEGVPRKGEGN
jgi:hypothetical protein